VVSYKGVVFYTFAAFWYIVTIEVLDILLIINSAYNRAKVGIPPG
jgi:hypothetical protein